MGGAQSVSPAAFPYYYVSVRLAVYVPTDNVIGGLVAEDFHIQQLGKQHHCIVKLQVRQS